jgi:large subunit ribosomal protein L1
MLPQLAARASAAAAALNPASCNRLVVASSALSPARAPGSLWAAAVAAGGPVRGFAAPATQLSGTAKAKLEKEKRKKKAKAKNITVKVSAARHTSPPCGHALDARCSLPARGHQARCWDPCAHPAARAAAPPPRRPPPQVRPGPTFHPDEALRLVRASATAAFDETVEVQVQLGIDPRKPTQNIRGVAPLPFGTGKAVNIAVFARGERAEEARRAGATLVGAEDLVDRIAKGEVPLTFTKTIATPDVMPLVGKVARVRGLVLCALRSEHQAAAACVERRTGSPPTNSVCLLLVRYLPYLSRHFVPRTPPRAQILGPRGLMPNPKLGTVTPNVRDAVLAAKKGQAEFRAEKRGLVMAGIGKASFEPAALRENLRSFLLALGDAKPEGLKGTYIRGGFLKSTMGPGFPLDAARLDPTSPTFLDVVPQAAAAVAGAPAAAGAAAEH